MSDRGSGRESVSVYVRLYLYPKTEDFLSLT